MCALQLLGMKGADVETDIWKIRIQLMKPVGDAAGGAEAPPQPRPGVLLALE